MRDASLGAEQLNQDRLNQVELDKALQELYIVKKQIDELNESKERMALNISKYKNYRLTSKFNNSNGILENDVYEVEYDNKEKEIYKLEDGKIVLLATIDMQNNLKLEEIEKARYKGIIDEAKLNDTYKLDEIDKERTEDEKKEENIKELDATIYGKDEQENDTGKNIDDNNKIASAIGVRPEAVLMVVEIKDELTMSRVVNKNIETMNLYAIQLRQDSGGAGGSNDWIFVNQKANGEFEQAFKDDRSTTMDKIADTTNIKWKGLTDPKINANDLNTIQKNGTRYVETRINGTYMDDQEGIIEVKKDGKATVHITREGCDGKAELLCDDEHELHDEEKIELPDRNVEIEETDEEDWTPGNKAYDERFGGERYHRH